MIKKNFRYYIQIILRFILFNIYIYACAINLNILILSYEINSTQFYNDIINYFNTYSNNNKLNISLNFDLYTPNNNTINNNLYYQEVYSLLKQKSSKYDLFLYNSIYISLFGNYFEDLDRHIPNYLKKLYYNNPAINSCLYKKILIGMPLYYDYSILYYNDKYLKKYGKKVPQTWNDLKKIGSEILSKEEKLGNNLIGYIPDISNIETTINSILEFIYTHRRNENDPLPSFTSKNTITALKRLKLLKSISTGNTLFARTWQLDEYNNEIISSSYLPGEQEGISASSMRIFSISVPKFINNKKKDASYKVINYLSSLEVQKKIVTGNNKLSGISSIYDNEVCQKIDCSLIKNLQYIDLGISFLDYIKFSEKMKNIVYEYLNTDISIEETLSKLDDITNVHYIKSSSVLGIFIIVVTASTIFLMGIFYIFLFKKQCYVKLNALDKKNWLIFIIGLIIMLCYCFTLIEELKDFTCFIRPILVFFGFSLSIIPIFVQLIINFPQNNKYSNYINKHKFVFILLFIDIEIIIFLLYLISPLSKEYYITNYTDELIFRQCELNTLFSIIINIINLFYIELLIICSIFLIFIEWNLENNNFNSKKLLFTLCFDLVFINVFIVIHLINIHNIYIYIISRFVTIYILILIHYLILYGNNIIIGIFTFQNENKLTTTYIKSEDEKKSVNSISTFRSSYMNNALSSKSNQEGEESMIINTIHYKSNIFGRIMGYHFSKKKNSSRNTQEIVTGASSINTEFSVFPKKIWFLMIHLLD
ncbi:periplasmic binding protein-like II [Neocallimastix sp. 'constans']